MQKIIANPNTSNIPGMFLNILSQAVIPKIVNKAIDALDNRSMQTELPTSQSATTVSQPNMVINKSEQSKQPRVTVNVNFFINDPEHKIDPSTYVPIRFIE